MSKTICIESDSVGKSCAYRNKHVCFVNSFIGNKAAVHTDKAVIQPFAVAENSRRHKRMTARRTRFVYEHTHKVRGLRRHHAAAYFYNRSFCLVYKCRSLFDLVLIYYCIVNYNLGSSFFVFGNRRRNVLGYINKYGTFPSGICYFKSLSERRSKFLYVADKKIMLCNRHCNACNVYFLESVLTYIRCSDVACYGYHRYAVHICRGNSRNKVCGAGTACRNYNPRFAGCPCIAVSSMGRALLVSCQDMMNFISVFIKCIIDIEYRSAGIAENCVYPLLYKHLSDYIRSVKLHLFLLPINKFKIYFISVVDKCQ